MLTVSESEVGPYQTIRRDQWWNRLAGSRGLHSCHGSVLIIRVNRLILLHTQMVKDALGMAQEADMTCLIDHNKGCERMTLLLATVILLLFLGIGSARFCRKFCVEVWYAWSV
jgi:hypothetical protein